MVYDETENWKLKFLVRSYLETWRGTYFWHFDDKKGPKSKILVNSVQMGNSNFKIPEILLTSFATHWIPANSLLILPRFDLSDDLGFQSTIWVLLCQCIKFQSKNDDLKKVLAVEASFQKFGILKQKNAVILVLLVLGRNYVETFIRIQKLVLLW